MTIATAKSLKDCDGAVDIEKITDNNYYKKVKTDEIARQLNLSHANVLVKLHRIRERLKKQLQNEYN